MTNSMADARKAFRELAEALNRVSLENFEEQIEAEEGEKSERGPWEKVWGLDVGEETPEDPEKQVFRPGQWVMADWDAKGRIVQAPLGPAWEEDTPGGARYYRVRFPTGVEKLLSTCLKPCAPELWPENRAVPGDEVRVVAYPSRVDGSPEDDKALDDSILAGQVVRVDKVMPSSVGFCPVEASYTVTRNGVSMRPWAFNCIRLEAGEKP